MTVSRASQQVSEARELKELDARISTLLPARYQHCSSVSPTSMGSAALKHGADGKVLWDSIWTTFCDLALAGGPPHRGTLLEPVSAAEAAADPERYAAVVGELRRAVEMTAELPTLPGGAGWFGVQCESAAQAAWLRLAVTAENVSARQRESVLLLPAGPAFRVEKEIKNVVVALAKACHYWDGHLGASQQTLGAGEWWSPATEDEASTAAYRRSRDEIARGLQGIGRQADAGRYTGWIGVETSSETEAAWLIRALLVSGVLVRREGSTLFLAVSATMTAAQTAQLVDSVAKAWSLRHAAAKRS